VVGVRVLLSEGSSLTAREVLTCLGPADFHVEALDPDRLCIDRFSRWMRKVHACPRPGADPVGYLDAVKRVVRDRRIDVVLPTHEQAWLFAAGAPLLSGVPLAVADVASFDRVQSKVEFARLLDELRLPQPRWRLGPATVVALRALDTALAVLALRDQHGRAWLLRTQSPDGAWSETTRPAGAVSYAERISTAAWVAQALLEMPR